MPPDYLRIIRLYSISIYINILGVNIHVSIDISRIQIIKSATVYFQAPFAPRAFVPPPSQGMLSLERAYAVPAICSSFLFFSSLVSFDLWNTETSCLT